MRTVGISFVAPGDTRLYPAALIITELELMHKLPSSVVPACPHRSLYPAIASVEPEHQAYIPICLNHKFMYLMELLFLF